MSIKVAINGFGRIGRTAFRIYAARENLNYEIVAINDLFGIENAAQLLKYDSVFGKFDGEIIAEDENLIVNGKVIKGFKERNPENLPWKELGIDIVIESTGFFRTKEKAMLHIKAGAKKVVISAPAKDEDVTLVLGVNEEVYDPKNHNIISNASCTTNCLAPVAKIINDKFGISEALMTTIHSYTGDQKLLDTAHADPRRARAAALNIIPTTTGAAKAVELVIPELKGKFTGMAIRVPSPTVSLVDVVFKTKKTVTVESVNSVLKEAAENQMKGILEYCDEPLVSMDFRRNSHSSIVDALSTMVIGDNMLKVISWYDNEWGYSERIVDLVDYIAKKGL
ncbi:MAG: type I glyceraldehyde-3-phosphate dehydrogenase [Clostridiales bacterium]|nr:type I glyceraldehyde-3-phosphate dehydrogenase [Clostridiales bacterium]